MSICVEIIGLLMTCFSSHPRSSKVTHIDRVTMTSYYWSIVTIMRRWN